MLHLTSLPVRCYSKAQATTISIIASLLPGVSWRRLTKASQLVVAHTPSSHTNPNEARQFRVEFNKSPARGRSAGNQVWNYAQRHHLKCDSARCCITKRQAPCLNTHWI